MNWKNRLTNYNFWISIISAILLILQALKIEFDIAYINEIATAVLGLLVVIGIISDPTKLSVKSSEIKTSTQKVNSEIDKTENSADSVELNNVSNGIKDNLKQNLTTDESNQIMPSDEQNSIGNNTVQDDFKNIINTISKDLNQNNKIIDLFENIYNLLKGDVELTSNTNILTTDNVDIKDVNDVITNVIEPEVNFAEENDDKEETLISNDDAQTVENNVNDCEVYSNIVN